MKVQFNSLVKGSEPCVLPPVEPAVKAILIYCLPTVFCSWTQGTGGHVRGRYYMSAFFGLILYTVTPR